MKAFQLSLPEITPSARRREEAKRVMEELLRLRGDDPWEQKEAEQLLNHFSLDDPNQCISWWEELINEFLRRQGELPLDLRDPKEQREIEDAIAPVL